MEAWNERRADLVATCLADPRKRASIGHDLHIAGLEEGTALGGGGGGGGGSLLGGSGPELADVDGPPPPRGSGGVSGGGGGDLVAGPTPRKTLGYLSRPGEGGGGAAGLPPRGYVPSSAQKHAARAQVGRSAKPNFLETRGGRRGDLALVLLTGGGGLLTSVCPPEIPFPRSASSPTPPSGPPVAPPSGEGPDGAVAAPERLGGHGPRAGALGQGLPPGARGRGRARPHLRRLRLHFHHQVRAQAAAPASPIYHHHHHYHHHYHHHHHQKQKQQQFCSTPLICGGHQPRGWFSSLRMVILSPPCPAALPPPPRKGPRAGPGSRPGTGSAPRWAWLDSATWRRPSSAPAPPPWCSSPWAP